MVNFSSASTNRLHGACFRLSQRMFQRVYECRALRGRTNGINIAHDGMFMCNVYAIYVNTTLQSPAYSPRLCDDNISKHKEE